MVDAVETVLVTVEVEVTVELKPTTSVSCSMNQMCSSKHECKSLRTYVGVIVDVTTVVELDVQKLQ